MEEKDAGQLLSMRVLCMTQAQRLYERLTSLCSAFGVGESRDKGEGAQVYTHAKELYPAVPRFCLKWSYRLELLLREIEYWSPDILCLQEIDHPLDFENFLKPRGYEGDYASRTGGRADGCLTAWYADPAPRSLAALPRSGPAPEWVRKVKQSFMADALLHRRCNGPA